jgi:hypothetical protein
VSNVVFADECLRLFWTTFTSRPWEISNDAK